MQTLKYFIFIFFLSFSASGKAQEVIFEEHFNGKELNMEHWNYEEGDGCPDLCGWGNKELQIYDRDFVSVEDGKLVITADKIDGQYFSGKINSKDKVEFQYGIIEVKAKLATGKGLWPAVWMLGSNISEVGWPASGEIDLMEYVGKEPNTIYSSLHTPANHGENANSRKTEIEGIEEGFHVYKTIWTEKEIKYFIDGKPVYTFIPEKYDKAHFPFRKPFYFLINMALGGNFGGPEVDDSVFPAKFYVDYIKVTELKEDEVK